jgi:hypothetical protein
LYTYSSMCRFGRAPAVGAAGEGAVAAGGRGAAGKQDPTPDNLLDYEFGVVYTREAEGLPPLPGEAPALRLLGRRGPGRWAPPCVCVSCAPLVRA